MATPNDNVTKEYLDNRLEDVTDHIDETFEKYTNQIFDKIDPILKEVKDAGEERTIIDDRLTKLEEAVFGN